jgi:pyrimidine-nucleoside phosphorylase
MRAVDIIRKKRDCGELSRGEIAWMVEGIARGDVADYQWSALLMAICKVGMTEAETVALTETMMHSGSIVDLGSIQGPKIDKHSTGGVGDKTSLILAPIAAAAGVLVPMVSGRGLGHTGGTLDKLEAIPGFRVDLDLDQYKSVLKRCGLVLIGQTAEIAPADKFLYALRDATATVESRALITASIMSKKLAEWIDGLVLDVKTGNGAFLQDLAEATLLAQGMCQIGCALGKRMAALVTRMDQPLGCAVGNAVEVSESIACLKGQGPADLMDLSIELAANMVALAGLSTNLADARAVCRSVVDDGQALMRFRLLIEAQGGDPTVVDEPSRLPQPRRRVVLQAPQSGVVRQLQARPIGQATMLLGAGRARVESRIDPAVGIILHRKVGESVAAGDPLCTLLVNDESRLAEVSSMVLQAYEIGEGPVAVEPLVVSRF